MGKLTVAIYARVSSDQQAEAGTIESQLEALKHKVHESGLELEPEQHPSPALGVPRADTRRNVLWKWGRRAG